jgi:hypothetical protein
MTGMGGGMVCDVAPEATFERVRGMVPRPGSPRGAFLDDAIDTATSRRLCSIIVAPGTVSVQEVRWTLRRGWEVIDRVANLPLEPHPAELLRRADHSRQH